jgi:hypothetical protein
MSGLGDSEHPEAEKAHDFFGIGFDPLTDSDAFPRLSEAELGEIAPLGERCSFDENEPLFSVGDYPYNCFVIISGRVRSVDLSTGDRVVSGRQRHRQRASHWEVIWGRYRHVGGPCAKTDSSGIERMG